MTLDRRCGIRKMICDKVYILGTAANTDELVPWKQGMSVDARLRDLQSNLQQEQLRKYSARQAMRFAEARLLRMVGSTEDRWRLRCQQAAHLQIDDTKAPGQPNSQRKMQDKRLVRWMGRQCTDQCVDIVYPSLLSSSTVLSLFTIMTHSTSIYNSKALRRDVCVYQHNVEFTSSNTNCPSYFAHTMQPQVLFV